MTTGVLPRNTVYQKAKDYVTYYYETSKTAPDCYGVTAGNFDNAGISHGIIQFNFYSGTLQPIWKDLINNYPSVCLTAFNNVTADYNTWVDVVKNRTTTDQIAWGESITNYKLDASGNIIKSSGHSVKEPWATYFRQLGMTTESITRQDTAVQPYLDNGENWKKKYSCWSRRAFLLLFDIAVQSGSISSAVDTLIQQDIQALSPTLSKNDREIAIMRSIANRRADAVGSTYQQSYRDRKLAIANGSGLVYGSPTDTTPYDMILEPAFDYDVDYPPFPAIRYVRDWLNGSNENDYNYWNEIRVTDINGNIISTGKSITSNATIINPTNITDNTVSTYGYETSVTGAKYAQLDLGAIHTDIKSIEVFHYYATGIRTFNGTKVEVSSDGTNWVTLRDSAVSGTYLETSAGITLKSNTYPTTEINPTPTEKFPAFRYVRDWLNGNTVNPNNYWNDIKVMVAGTNIAQNILATPIPNSTLNQGTNITDGNNTTYGYILSSVGDTPDYVQIDLGTTRSDVESINIIHFFGDNRSFYGTKTEISFDGIVWKKLFDSAYDGIYQETSQGKTYYPANVTSNEEEPKVSIVGVSLNRMSDEIGFQKSNITFKFHVPVSKYTVRCNSTNYLNGIDCETGSKTVLSQAQNYSVIQASQVSVIGFASIPQDTNITAEIDYTELEIEGDNQIAVYGRNLSGVWSS